MQMSSPRNVVEPDAKKGATTSGSESSASDSYRSPSITPSESPKAKKARLELQRDPTYEPEEDPVDEVYIIGKVYN